MAYIGNGRTLLVLGSNVRDDIVPDNTTSTFTLSQEVPGGYESNVYVFKQTYITERLITNSTTTTITIPQVLSGTTWTIESADPSVAAALSDIKETVKLYTDANHTLTISGSSVSANNGTFPIIDCTYNGSTIIITLNRPGAQASVADTTSSFTISRGYSGFWEILEPEEDYTIGGTGITLNRQISFAKVPKVDDKIYVVHKGDATYNLVPSDNSVGPNQLSANLRNFTIDKFVGDGVEDEYALSQSAVNASSILVTVDGVVKEESTDYTLDSNGTALTFAAPPANSSKIRVLHLGFSTVSRRAVLSPGQSGPVAPGSIDSAALATSAVTDTKLAPSAVLNSKIAANAVTSDKILLTNNTALRSYRSNGTTIFSAITLNSSDELILNTPTTAHISVNATKTLNVSSSLVSPETTEAIAIGSSTKKFTDAHFSGQINSATANITGNITVGGTVDGVDVSTLNTTVSTLQTLVNNLVPIGTMMVWPHASVPNSNWLLCDGSAISRSTYSSLFSLISTTYGSGDGSTTFNLPDLRKRVAVGAGTGLNVATTDGIVEASRNLNHTHSVPAHNHGLQNHTHTIPAHFHSMGTGATLNITSSGSHTTTIDISHSHTVNSGSGTTGGSGTLTTNRSPTGVSLVMGPHDHGGATVAADPAHSHSMQSAGSHTHGIRVENGTSSGERIQTIASGNNSKIFTGQIESDGAHTHTINSTSISHAHGIDVVVVPFTWTEPNSNQGHDHTINSHSHSVSVDALPTTNRNHTGGAHTHASSDFSGSIGLVTGGVDGNAPMTSGSAGAGSTDNSTILTTGSTLNLPYTVVNYVIRAL